MFAVARFCLPNFWCIVGRMEPQWERLGEAVLYRRTTQGWTQEEVRERGGPSDTLQTEIEAKKWKPTRSVKGTLRKIDDGLLWTRGSSADVLAGLDPTPLSAEAIRESEFSTWVDDEPDVDDEPRKRSGAGHGLSGLIPEPTAEEAAARAADRREMIEVNKEVIADGWNTALKLTETVLASDPSDELLEAAREAVHFIDAYLIIRILTSGFAPDLESWLARIYRERDVLHKRLSRGDVPTPWLTERFESPEAAAAYFVNPPQQEEDNDVEVEEESSASEEGRQNQKTRLGDDAESKRLGRDLDAAAELEVDGSDDGAGQAR